MIKIQNINFKKILNISDIIICGFCIAFFIAVMGAAILFLILSYIVGLFELPLVFIPFTIIWIICTIVVYNKNKNK